MKKFAICVLVCLAVLAGAVALYPQGGTTSQMRVRSGDPSTCNVDLGLFYFDSASKRVRVCEATDTFGALVSQSDTSTTSVASKIVKADGVGKIADGWLSANVSLLGASIDLGSEVTGLLPQSNVTNLTTDLAAKLPLAGGTLTGVVQPNATGLDFGASGARFDIFAQTIDASGSLKTTGASDQIACFGSACVLGGSSYMDGEVGIDFNETFAPSTGIWNAGASYLVRWDPTQNQAGTGLYGMWIDSEIVATNASNINFHYGFGAIAYMRGSGAIAANHGLYFGAYALGGGAVTKNTAAYLDALVGAGNAALQEGASIHTENSGAGVVTDNIGLHIESAVNSGAGSITTNYGIKVKDQTAGVTNYAIFTGAGLVRFGGQVTGVGGFVGALTGNAATATALASDPTDCSANQFATAIAASGNLTCAQPSSANLSDAANIPLLNAANVFTADGGVTLDNQKELRLRELTANGTNYFAFKAPASITSNVSFTWAATGQCTGANGGALTINVSLEIVCSDDDGGAGGGSPGGSGSELQYRVDGSTFGAVTGSSVSGATITLGGTLTVAAGTTGAGTAPLKFQAGSLMTSPEAHAVEWDGSEVNVTTAAGSRSALERVSRKNAASGYAGLDGSTKLVAAQGQEVWALADMTDVSGTSGTGSTVLLATITTPATGHFISYSAGGNWVNSAPDADLVAIAALTRTRGDLIIGGVSDWTDLAIGGAATFLRSDGTDPSWQAITDADVPDTITASNYQLLDADLTALAAFSSTGFAVRTAADTWAQRSFADSGRIAWTNPAGVAGNPSADLVANSVTGSHIDESTLSGIPAAGISGTAVVQSFTLTGGAGIAAIGDLSTPRTISTASGEADFLASGALTCGAGTQGKMQVHTTPLQYCDNAGTPALQYAAYGDSAGAALSGDSATSFFPTGTIEAARLPSASDTALGVVELATITETNTGTDTGRAVTPDGLAGSVFGEKIVQIIVFDFTTDTATGDGKFYFIVPASLNGMNLVGVRAEVVTAGTTGTLNVDLARCATAASGNLCSGTVVDMLSTNITIDSGENSTDTAAAAAVIDTANDDVATGQVIRVDVDAIHTTAAKGLIVTLTLRLP